MDALVAAATAAGEAVTSLKAAGASKEEIAMVRVSSLTKWCFELASETSAARTAEYWKRMP